MNIAIKAAEVDRSTNSTSQPTRWITAIRIYATCSAACTVHRKWSQRVRAFRGTVQEGTSLVVLVGSHCVFCLRVSAFVHSSRWYLPIYFRVGADRPTRMPLYLLLRDAKQMLSTWAAWSNIIIKSRGMIERCRMLIIAFRRVAAGRQVCFTVYLLFLDGSVSSTSRVSWRSRVENLNKLRKKRFNLRAIRTKR